MEELLESLNPSHHELNPDIETRVQPQHNVRKTSESNGGDVRRCQNVRGMNTRVHNEYVGFAEPGSGEKRSTRNPR